MHPAMAVWIWSMTSMSRIWQATLMGEEYRSRDDFLPAKSASLLIRAHAYLITDIAKHRLPDILLIGSPIFIGRSGKPHSRSNHRFSLASAPFKAASKSSCMNGLVRS